MHLIDWLIVIIPLLIVAVVAFRTQHYVTGVSDFLVAGRVANRYVVAVAGYSAAMGLISAVAIFEFYYKSGFALSFWQTMAEPIIMVITLTGFAVYRFREARAMTLGQLDIPDAGTKACSAFVGDQNHRRYIGTFQAYYRLACNPG